ncbi:ABC transporter ATP-binding protein [Ensifer adhaerens]|uniref:ABC transporter ATP-binding protein n=1 Tax=Ensifer adhaerens TaxID=106592 RepID=UPI001CC083AC|nr:ABC transporter ATP-binding protein [Ensifer adhaerens]MBZ7924967.1 ABC transporter ATP-binding protein [Ensifer adhaerens]UAX95825.1 ABC transporter ATP-binding protein [Ensifer adhaerens]UAY04834.1 ABC transporter ATP-binding protein [Ensifer adhaerens]UAY10266.1 ABC transporter ATP-binding protein [Ensifer adhaerens]
MNPTEDPLVSIRGLSVEAAGGRGPIQMLRGVDIDIAPGRIVGVVGESGSGKSTLASAIIGILASNVTSVGGAIRFGGIDLLTLDESGKRNLRGDRIAMIFQDPMTVLNPVFKVGTQLVDVVKRKKPRTSRAAALKEAEAMLQRVGISDPVARLECYPHQLSGGMRQRVMIAMALLTNPQLILADEPTTALDATVEAQIVELFRDLQRETSSSVLFISHHLGLLSEFCDDAIVLYAGLVMEAGPMAELISNPRHPYTAALLGCEIDEGDTGEPLRTIPGGPPSPSAPLTGCAFAARCTAAEEACYAAPIPMKDLGGGVSVRCIRA